MASPSPSWFLKLPSNRFATGVENEATGDSKLNNPDTRMPSKATGIIYLESLFVTEHKIMPHCVVCPQPPSCIWLGRHYFHAFRVNKVVFFYHSPNLLV